MEPERTDPFINVFFNAPVVSEKQIKPTVIPPKVMSLQSGAVKMGELNASETVFQLHNPARINCNQAALFTDKR